MHCRNPKPVPPLLANLRSYMRQELRQVRGCYVRGMPLLKIGENQMIRLVRFDHTNPQEIRLDVKPTEKKGVILDIYSMKLSEGMDFELDNSKARTLVQALNTMLDSEETK